jgi:hypothetical protein
LRRKRRIQRLGSLAQLVERHVYTVDVIGSIPVGPTTKTPHFLPSRLTELRGFVVGGTAECQTPAIALQSWNT